IVQGTFQRFIRVGQKAAGGWEESQRYTNNTDRNYYVVYNTAGYATLYANAVAPTTGPTAVTFSAMTGTDSYGFRYETGHFTGSKNWTPPSITHNSKGGTDVYLSKFGSIPSSSDSSMNVFSVKAPQLSFNVPTITMDPTAQGQSSSKSFTGILCNTGDFPVVISSTTFGGANGTDFKILGNLIGVRIDPGKCLSIEFLFTPTSLGNLTAVLDVAGGCGAFTSLQLSGQALAPCAYDVKSVDLGKVPLGTTPTFPVTCVIKNTGPANLSGTITKTGSPDVTIDKMGAFNLAPNACLDIVVSVNAQTAGSQSITLDFGLAAECGVPLSTITVDVVEPKLSITNVDFGRKRVLTVSTDTITITNLNTEPAVITALTLTPASDPHLTLTLPGTPINLAPNQSVDIPVRYVPQARGAHLVTVSATVQGQAQPLVGEAKGFGFLPEITATGHTFNPWTVGLQSPEVGNVVITNSDADADLHIENVRFASATTDFAWAGTLPTFPQTLRPGEVMTLPVNFTPQTLGERTIQVCIDHDAMPGPGPIPPYTQTCVTVNGPGIEPSDLPPVVMGDVLTCATKTQIVRITNPNPTVLLNCDAPVGTGDLSAFSVQPNAPFTVMPGMYIDLTIVYTPPTVGSHAVTYSIANDQGLRLNLNVSGTGVTTTAAFTFGTLVEGIIGQGAIMPIQVNVGAIDTVTVGTVTIDMSFPAETVSFKQLTTPQQAGWTFITDATIAGQLRITGTSAIGATLVDGDFVTPEFEVYLTADSALPVVFTTTVDPSCVVATGDDGNIKVKDVCFAAGRLVKFGEAQFSLDTPKPNPARDHTMVTYSTGIELSTTFELVDAMGNVVRTIMTPVLKSGHYEVDIETSTLSSGLYILRMSSGPYISTQMISVVK
ncbi:MAG: T9SS C-terminal target domain-containing protein, partial [Ignavibacteriae bacterium]